MLIAGSRLGPYEVIAPLGAGGMGVVYRARDTRLGRDVAIKVLPAEFAADPERLRRFEQEARAVAALNHPNILVVYDVGTHEGAPYLVEELLEGESLRERLHSGALPPRKVIELAAQVCSGLAAAHDKGIIHRDLKPENLFVTSDGHLKILDFGLAKLLPLPQGVGGAPTVVDSTAPGMVMGTVAYMSPEQVRGQPADHRSDIFSFGCVLFEMLSGARAFQRESSIETMNAILKDEPQDLTAVDPKIPPGLARVVQHCLEKQPDDRFQSARDMSFALESASGFASAGLPTGTAATPTRSRARLGFAPVVALLIAVAGGAAGIAFFVGERLADRAHPGRVIYRRITVRHGEVFGARFSPDGNTVFYSAAWDTNPPEIFEVRPGFPTSRAMGLTETELFAVSRNGKMAVRLAAHGLIGPTATAGTLAEVPISGGTPRSLMAEIRSADWSPDGTALAVAHTVGAKWRLEMPPGKVLYETSGFLFSVRVSPSGEYLAFVEWPIPMDSRGSLVIIDKTGRVRARTQEWSSIISTAWSAKGDEAWFSASQDGSSFDLRALTPSGQERVVERFPVQVWIEDISRTGQVLLDRAHSHTGMRGRRSPDDDERELGWLDYPDPIAISHDGRTLLFDEQGIGGGPLYAVCIRGMDGSPAVRLGEGHGCALSPNGAWALAVHFGPPPRLVLLPTGIGEAVSLPAGTIEKYDDARFLPDGEHVLFVGSEAGRPWRTFVQDVHGGAPRPITPEGVAGVHVSPDGRFITAGTSGQRELHIYPLGGGEPRRVGELLPNETVFEWTADGRGLFVGQPGASLEVDRLDLDSGKRARWRTFSMPDPVGVAVWNLVVTPDGRSYAYGYFRDLSDLFLVEGLK